MLIFFDGFLSEIIIYILNNNKLNFFLQRFSFYFFHINEEIVIAL